MSIVKPCRSLGRYVNAYYINYTPRGTLAHLAAAVKKVVSIPVIAVCGAGLVGCEVAMFLAEQGKDVTMVDILSSAAPDMSVFSKWVLEGKLAELGVKVKVNHKITEMTGEYVSCEIEGKHVTFKADSVVCALGLKSCRGILEELRASCKGVDIIPVGDVNKPRKIMQATHEGFHAARRV